MSTEPCDGCANRATHFLCEDCVDDDIAPLKAAIERLTAERDALVQARESWLADCAKELRETADDMIAIRKEHERAAFARGVAAMRDAAAVWVADFCSFSKARRILALPDPKDKP